ncbi:MAG: sugar ABC transporter permease [Chloroflexi bacterium]|nr:sugar ABC transporter permease [Chloroflexota bacterium]
MAQTQQGQRSRRPPWRRGEAVLGFLYILPATVILGVFHFWPMIYAVYISLHRWRVIKQAYVGLANYKWVLTNPKFWNALKVTIYYVIGTVPIQLALGLVLAYLLFQDIKGREAFRTIYFLPYITSTIASGAVFAWMFNPQEGPINRFLEKLGLPPQRWLLEPRGIFTLLGDYLHIPWLHGGPSLALVTIMIFVIWFWVGYDATIFLAGLGSIPSELYEAARIDGANRWQLFRHITLPLLSPTTFFLSLVAVIGSFKAFNHIFIMTDASSGSVGGPLDTTTTVTILFFKNFYDVPTYGKAAAIAFVLFIIILVLSLLQNWLASKRVFYME